MSGYSTAMYAVFIVTKYSDLLLCRKMFLTNVSMFALLCPPSGNMDRKECLLVGLPLGNMAIGNTFPWFAHLWETWRGNIELTMFSGLPTFGNGYETLFWFAYFRETWL
jgi:hypothetical protein